MKFTKIKKTNPIVFQILLETTPKSPPREIAKQHTGDAEVHSHSHIAPGRARDKQSELVLEEIAAEKFRVPMLRTTSPVEKTRKRPRASISHVPVPRPRRTCAASGIPSRDSLCVCVCLFQAGEKFGVAARPFFPRTGESRVFDKEEEYVCV